MGEIVLRPCSDTATIAYSRQYITSATQLLYFVWGHLIQDTSIRVRKSEMVRLGFGDMDPTGGEATWRGIGDTHAIVDTVAASRAEFI